MKLCGPMLWFWGCSHLKLLISFSWIYCSLEFCSNFWKCAYQVWVWHQIITGMWFSVSWLNSVFLMKNVEVWSCWIWTDSFKNQQFVKWSILSVPVQLGVSLQFQLHFRLAYMRLVCSQLQRKNLENQNLVLQKYSHFSPAYKIWPNSKIHELSSWFNPYGRF